MRQFTLNYDLENGKVVEFKFDETVDFEKYNKTILELYGKQIKRRFVIDMQTGELMSLKQLRAILKDNSSKDL